MIPVAPLLADLRDTLAFIGPYRPEPRTVWLAGGLALVLSALGLLAFQVAGLWSVVTGSGFVAGKLRALDPGTAALALLPYAWIQTSLSEEILFRGFLGRRLIARLGFGRGNALQALLFGGVHLALVGALAPQGFTVLQGALFLIFPTVSGYLLGYLKERAGNGSILPGWWAHGLSNFLSFGLVGIVMR